MEDKIKSGIIHCADYVCNGCPYESIGYSAESYMNGSAARYVRCMQALINDIHTNLNAKENTISIIHAKWIKNEEMRRCDGHIYDYCCSHCKGFAGKGIYNNYDIKTPYCPHCGAKMSGM